MNPDPWIEKSRLFADKLPASVKHRWIRLDNIGAPQPYSKTHAFDDDFINARHAEIGRAPLGRMGIPICIDLGIDGYLQRAEALKLYELAFFNDGDALELGTHRGLSTCLIAWGLLDNDGADLETIDIDPTANALAKANVANALVGHKVTFTLKDATDRLDEMVAVGKKVGLIFVDHWHGYKETFEAAERGLKLLSPGGYIFFHDFLDPGNIIPEHPYGVYQAVLDVFGDDQRAQFCGLFGSAALFRMTD